VAAAGAAILPVTGAMKDSATRPADRAAELKIVSVLFADLVGFTTSSEARDPEAVRETLTRYFETAATVIERYGGTVEKFIGDAVMAVWGTPVAHEDDAERAVRAALDLVEAVARLGDAVDAPELRLRAAVLTGEAAVTLGARGQGMVAGDLVNAASRLQGHAEPGTVLVGDATAHAAAAAVQFETIGALSVKGRDAPLVAHRAVRVVGKRGGVGRSESLEAPFVGRDAELNLIRDLYHATALDRRARLVSIVGQAGVGKSRLLWEFSKYTDGLLETIRWHQGRSPAYGEGVTFWALGEMIRQRAGITEGEDAATTRAKLSATVAEWIPDDADRRWIEPSLRQLLGVHDGGAIERDELFAAWRSFFEHVARTDPTVLVFEDVQWADSGLLDFIEYLLEWSRTFPLYIVTTARPELLERRPTWGAGQRSFTSLSLEPLPDRAMRALLAGLVPGLPVPVVEAILARAEGIPLYAVETVRMLLHEGRLERDEGAYRPTGDLSTIAVPDSLHSLIAARLDALEPDDRSLLQDAAVLGQTFSIPALAAVSGDEVESIEGRLRGLARREIVVLDTDPRSPERGQYGFVQALIRDVAYGLLAKRDRRSRHLAAARYYEALGDDELAGVLARHYLAAFHAAPTGDEGNAMASQARIALRAAADRAEALGSYDQARAYLEQTLTVAAEPAERAELHERVARAAQAAGRIDVADAGYRDAAELFGAAGDRRSRARVLAALGGLNSFSGRTTDAVDVLSAAIREFEDILDTPEGVRLRIRYAASLLNLGGSDTDPLPLLDAALTQAEHLDLVEDIADGLVVRSTALTGTARPREAAALLRGAQALAQAHGLTDIDLRARNNLVFHDMTVNPRAGVAVARTGIEEARRLGRLAWWFGILGNAAPCALRTGDWDWLIEALDEALAMDPEGYNEIELGDARALMSALRGEDVMARLRSHDDAIALLSDTQSSGSHLLFRAWIEFLAGDAKAAFASALASHETSSFMSALALPLAARAALWMGDAGDVRRAAAALDASGSHGQAVDADRATIDAALAAIDRDRDDSFRRYRAAIERWRELGLMWDQALCQLDLARTFPGDADVAGEEADAREALARLGADVVVRVFDALRPGGHETRSTQSEPAGEGLTAATRIA
jgi:class 3 adenylate cyclase/tetratricopeptide (TPR) repeat protein